MTRSRWYSVVMPIYAILYVIALYIGSQTDHGSPVAVIGAMGFAIIAIAGRLFPPATSGTVADQPKIDRSTLDS